MSPVPDPVSATLTVTRSGANTPTARIRLMTHHGVGHVTHALTSGAYRVQLYQGGDASLATRMVTIDHGQRTTLTIGPQVCPA